MAGRAEVGELSAEQQEKLQRFKVTRADGRAINAPAISNHPAAFDWFTPQVTLRNDNERYLNSHPEVDVMIGDFLRNVLLKRPTDIREFAADHFSDPNLQVVIASKMEGNME
ncbi:RIIa domain-containing protein 1 isoform 1-T1 [Spinachia spinachia]